MRIEITFILFTISLTWSQVKREKFQGPEAYLDVPIEIASVETFQAPRMEGALRGESTILPPVRTMESVSEEVRESQSRLAYLYKTWKFKKEPGIGRKFGLAMTITPSGEVQNVVVTGLANKEFAKAVQENIKTWSFSKVKSQNPYVVRLRNLDILYRKSLTLE